MAAHRRDRDHALPPRPLGRPRAVGLGQLLPARARRPAPGALGLPRRARASSRSSARGSGSRTCSSGRSSCRSTTPRRRSRPRQASTSSRCGSRTTRLETYGFRVTNGDATLAYTGDTGPERAHRRPRARRRPVRLRGDARARRRRRRAARPPERRRGARRRYAASGARRLLLTHRPSELPPPGRASSSPTTAWSSRSSPRAADALRRRSRQRIPRPSRRAMRQDEPPGREAAGFGICPRRRRGISGRNPLGGFPLRELEHRLFAPGAPDVAPGVADLAEGDAVADRVDDHAASGCDPSTEAASASSAMRALDGGRVAPRLEGARAARSACARGRGRCARIGISSSASVW